MILTIKVPPKIAANEWPNKLVCGCCELLMAEECFPFEDKKSRGLPPGDEKSARLLDRCVMCRTDCTPKKCRLGNLH